MFKKIIIVSAGLMTCFAAQSAENNQYIHPGMKCSEMPTISEAQDQLSKTYREQFENLIQEGYDYSVTNINTCTETSYKHWGTDYKVLTNSKIAIFDVQKKNATRASTCILYYCLSKDNVIKNLIDSTLSQLSMMQGIAERSTYLVKIADSMTQNFGS